MRRFHISASFHTEMVSWEENINQHPFPNETDLQNWSRIMCSIINLTERLDECWFYWWINTLRYAARTGAKGKTDPHYANPNHKLRRANGDTSQVSRSPRSFCFLSSPPSHAAASPSSPRVPSLFYFCLSSSVRRTCVFSCPLFLSCSILSPLSLPFLFLLILRGPVLIQHSSSNLVLCPL